VLLLLPGEKKRKKRNLSSVRSCPKKEKLKKKKNAPARPASQGKRGEREGSAGGLPAFDLARRETSLRGGKSRFVAVAGRKGGLVADHIRSRRKKRK